MIFGFLADGSPETLARRAAGCAAATKPLIGGRLACHRVDDAVVGQWLFADVEDDARPAMSDDGRRFLWFMGEAFTGPSTLLPVDPASCQTLAFRSRLLALLDARGWPALQEIDGDFAVVVWDREKRRLGVAVDRFGLQRLYWTEGPRGFGFGSSVAAALVGVEGGVEPDLEALQDAVSAGGYPLAPRTYVRGVQLVLPHSAVAGRSDGAVQCTRYWSWSELREECGITTAEVVERSESLWSEAMRGRLGDDRRFVQTLSGGLDSRLILDEGSRRASDWVAISYGLAGCDDCVYAQAAAGAAAVRWVFHPLYSGIRPSWIERRLEWVMRTDGLVDFGNLMHTEVIDLVGATGDVVLHGYIGDFVCGPTYQVCRSVNDLVAQAPYYGGAFAWPWDDYAARLDAARPPGDYDLRFVHGEQKFVAHTNALFASIRHVARLRRPFVDHRFFDFWQTLPSEHRDGRTYRRWLRERHARLFGDIPWQKTGLPIGAAKWRLTMERGRRFATRVLKRTLSRAGIRTSRRQRQFFDDEGAMRVPEARALVRQTVLGRNAVAANAWNRSAMQDLVDQWNDRAAAPVQKIGALLSFEHYHRELPARLRRLRALSPLLQNASAQDPRHMGAGSAGWIIRIDAP